MRFVAARLTAPVLERPIVVEAVLTPHALVAGPGLDERAVDTEVLAREQSALAGHLHRGVEQFRHRFVLDQPIAVLAEHQVVPHHLIDCQTDEPAEQQVGADLLDGLALAANAVQHLQQHRPHEFLGRSAGTPAPDVGFVHRRELRIHAGQRVVDPHAHWAQRVVRRTHSSRRTLAIATRPRHPRAAHP